MSRDNYHPELQLELNILAEMLEISKSGCRGSIIDHRHSTVVGANKRVIANQIRLVCIFPTVLLFLPILLLESYLPLLKDLQPLTQLIGVMRRHDLTNKSECVFSKVYFCEVYHL